MADRPLSTQDAPVVIFPAAAVSDSGRTQMSANLANPACGKMHNHPLAEIAESPGHLLLMKLLHREEDLHVGRTCALESAMDAAKHEAFRLCCLFFAFHGLVLTLVFTASVVTDYGRAAACRNWWVPSLLSLLTSSALVLAVQARVCEYWCAARRLQRERADGREVARLTQELRMKGVSFDLSKREFGNAAAVSGAVKRFKSSSVELRFQPLRWCKRHVVTMCLAAFAGMLFPACKFILCG